MAPIMPNRALTFFCCILTFLHLLLYCTSLSQDGLILLKIKRGDWRDKRNALSDWNESHKNPCAWTGISCDTFNTVTAVDLTGASISGNLTSAICALSNLTALSLQSNDFTAPFPRALLHCKGLHKLDLSSNHFAGTLPSRISELSELRELNLSFNAFSGSIPQAFGMLPKLEALFFHDNSLSGPFPNFVGNLKSLKNLTFDNNPLRPSVLPTELGNLKKLQQLWLQNCSLVGRIPTFLGNLTQLEELDLSWNHLSGAIPASLMALENLTLLFLYDNNLSGQIPADVGQLRSLSELDFTDNQLYGAIPDGVGNLTYLNFLQLSSNRLTGEIPAEVGKLRYLSYLKLYGNKLSGWLPQSLGTFSNLILVDVVGNELEGPLPKNLCRGGVLYSFLGSSNNFNGSLPSSFQDCNSLEYLYIENNHLSGEIPPELWGASNLKKLLLSNNTLEGQISAAIGKAKNLSRLEISNNGFEGRIPTQFGKLTRLQVFEASNNRLSGPITHELGALSLVSTLQLDHNFLSGEIPMEITLLRKLSQLNLGHNRLTGEIPAALNDIMNSLHLSNNLLSGGIPPEFGHLKLSVFNVSNNDLSGRIPEALDIPVYKEGFLGNAKLCGGQNLMLPPCPSRHKLLPQSLATILLPPLLVVAVSVCSICLCCLIFRKPRTTPSWKLTPFHSADVDELYILHNLKESNVIGSGGAGKVYKVTLHNGQAVAVKKIWNMGGSRRSYRRKRELQEENKSGEVEVNTLGLIWHNNILKLLCCISSEDSYFKLLVYEFMPNGSLFDLLHGGSGPQTPLQWPIRYQIALDAARGLSYMHHDCFPPILHRDVKSSNILLDGDFGAKISDFGLSRVLDKLGHQYTVSGYVGSHGYIGVEYVERLRVDEKSDVYSFGVVILELVSGRKATGEREYGEGVDIVGWIRCTIWMGGEREVVDKRTVDDNCEEQMMRVLRVGLVCTKREPYQRHCMREVVEMLVACGGDNRRETTDERICQHPERISRQGSESGNEGV
ncbi:receptor-like protein kinase HSL1 [Cryptomeria japonica]|uniref:receptor-like protein kinase HSL1 n=1 Tax=Cryptomeria japonica TaxID=3369 RepID=UPI0027DAA0B7|nr:receptor-like protein kinase HSL1 [Cryptomeria japonica]